MAEVLRPYQQKIIKEAFESLNGDSNSVLLQMPTGTGKTHVFAEITRQWIIELEPNKKVLILAHRKELINQIINRLLLFDINGSSIVAGKIQNPKLQVQVAMVQSLRNPEKLPKDISLIIIDEAHHSTANSYSKIIEYYREENYNINIIGVTATPWRLNGQGFSDVFDKLITSNQITEFIQDNYLAPVKHYAASRLDLSRVKIDYRKKDYDSHELDKIIREDIRIAAVVDSYLRLGENKKAIVFALNQAHARELVEHFIEANVNAALIDSNTFESNRTKIVNDFRNGDIQVLCNVDIFTEGFDCPDVEVVLLARPTKSLALYLQQVGRVMRPSENKEHGIIIDNANLWEDHGFVTQPFTWALEYDLVEIELIKQKRKKILAKKLEQLPTELTGLDLIDILDFDLDFDDQVEIERSLVEYKKFLYAEISTLKVDDFTIHKISSPIKEIRIFQLAKLLQLSIDSVLEFINHEFRYNRYIIIGNWHWFNGYEPPYFNEFSRNNKLNEFQEYYVRSSFQFKYSKSLFFSNLEIEYLFHGIQVGFFSKPLFFLDPLSWKVRLKNFIEQNTKIFPIEFLEDKQIFDLLKIQYETVNPFFASELNIINLYVFSKNMQKKSSFDVIELLINDIKYYKWIELNTENIDIVTLELIEKCVYELNDKDFNYQSVYDRCFNGNKIANNRINEINTYLKCTIGLINLRFAKSELPNELITLNFSSNDEHIVHDHVNNFLSIVKLLEVLEIHENDFYKILNDLKIDFADKDVYLSLSQTQKIISFLVLRYSNNTNNSELKAELGSIHSLQSI